MTSGSSCEHIQQSGHGSRSGCGCSDSDGTNGDSRSGSLSRKRSSSSNSGASSRNGRWSSCSRSPSPGRPENISSLIDHLRQRLMHKGELATLRRGNNGVILSYVPHHDEPSQESRAEEKKRIGQGAHRTTAPAGAVTSTLSSNLDGDAWSAPMALKICYSKSRHIQNELEVLHSVRRAWEDGSLPRSELMTLPSLRVVWPSVRTHVRFSGDEDERRGGGSDCALLGLEKLGPDVFELTGRFRLSHAEIAECGRHMLAALRTLHRLGYVHKSVKPENFCFRLAHTAAPLPTMPHPGVDSNDARCGATADVGAQTMPHAWITIIDFGRAVRVNSQRSQRPASHYEEPFTGWWYSMNGFLGRPQGKADDLFSLVISIGYLLADALPPSHLPPGSGGDTELDDGGELFLEWRHREQKQTAKLRRDIRRSLPRGTADHVIADTAFAELRNRVSRTLLNESHETSAQHRCPPSLHEGVLRWIGLPSWWCTLFEMVHDHVLFSPNPSDESTVDALADGIAGVLTSAVTGTSIQGVSTASTCGSASSPVATSSRVDVPAFDPGLRSEVDRLVQRYVEERSGSGKPPSKRLKPELPCN